MKRGLSHKRLGVQRSMLEKMGRSFVLSIQTPLEEANKYAFVIIIVYFYTFLVHALYG